MLVDQCGCAQKEITVLPSNDLQTTTEVFKVTAHARSQTSLRNFNTIL
jgi:hypothetical protein